MSEAIKMDMKNGRRNRGNPPKIKFTERHDTPAFCLVKAICGIAFKDGAFVSEWIREPEDIYGIKIPDRLQSVPIKWAAEWKQTPVFRRTVRDVKGNLETSPTLATQYHQMANWNLRLGKSFGLKEPFEFKTLRRAAAAVLPEGVRSQAMGHVNGSIHERSYRNEVVDTDIVSAFLETPSDKSTMKLIGHTSLTRDPNAPTKPTPAHRHQVQEDTEIIEARRMLDSQTQTIINRYRSLAQATRNAQHDLKLQAELDHHAQLKREHNALFKRKLRAVFEQSRKQYFETLGVICLQNQHTGNPEPPRPDEQPFRFLEREDLIRLLFPRSLPTSPQQQVENSSKIIRLISTFAITPSRLPVPTPLFLWRDFDLRITTVSRVMLCRYTKLYTALEPLLASIDNPCH
ncbi:hypothetical protein EPUS_01610 [Endocarpon pusillum Z07020]|uniref:Uncharacterized protein n=1 Tax=Endocarpon pusillum (strain Z07020 / HMAS-L-300199) TaxID=1263415 RepID=U1HY58_ENDPU|nr:uncharacterized protein EPUS_01610 [Endocarpon pusillum Z07020]ERF75780.1 hypothetical protein EPUS_01610 [Endocarpon pusillum Z07020]